MRPQIAALFCAQFTRDHSASWNADAVMRGAELLLEAELDDAFDRHDYRAAVDTIASLRVVRAQRDAIYEEIAKKQEKSKK